MHYFNVESSYIFASRQKTHAKKIRPVSRILLLPPVSLALILSQNITSVFSLPEFAPRTGVGSMRDVSDISVDVNEFQRLNTAKTDTMSVTAFSKQAIRIVDVKPDSLILTKTIDYPGAITGIRRASYALVATKDSYDLIDLDNTRKIPLFPVRATTPKDEEECLDTADIIRPLIIPVGIDEFLVTSGTTNDEPAMGIVVNVDGDISRGTIPWPRYPKFVAVDDLYVTAVVGNQIMIHSLYDQALVQTIDYEVQPILSHVMATYSVPYEPLADKLRLIPLSGGSDPDRESREKEQAAQLCILSSSLFVYSDNGVECLVPKPRLFHFEELVLKGKIDEVKNEVENFDVTSELRVLELQYLTLLIGLSNLLHKNYESAIESFSVLDPRIVIWMFEKGHGHLYGELWTFNGIVPLLESIKLDTKIYHTFLTHFLGRRESESLADRANVFRSIEMSLLSLAKTEEDYFNIIDNHIEESFEEAVEYFESKKQYLYLSRLYEKKKMDEQVLIIWKGLLSGQWSDSVFSLQRGPEKMASYLIQCKDEALVMEYGMWLVEAYPEFGMSVFVSPSRLASLDDDKVLDKLKELDDERAWREYLKFLVYVKKSKLFTADLVAFLLDDLIQTVSRQKPVLSKELIEYKSLDLPKPSYLHFLNGRLIQRKGVESEIAKLRLDLISLLVSDPKYSENSVLRRLQEEAREELAFEIAVVSSLLGLHEPCLDILCQLTDFSTMIDYCKEGRPIIGMTTQSDLGPEIQEDLTRMVFHKFLRLPDQIQRFWCIRKLIEKWGHRLDVYLLISKMPGDWPVEILANRLGHYFASTLVERNQSITYRSLSRSESIIISKQLEDLMKIDV